MLPASIALICAHTGESTLRRGHQIGTATQTKAAKGKQ